MDAFMSNMTANQALEWEIFSKDSPSFEDALLNQVAYIACFFASATLKKKDGSGFTPEDFMPWNRGKTEKAKKVKKGSNLVSAFKAFALKSGDEKTKAWAAEGVQDRPKVRGTNGKWYNYALEEFATRVKPPRRILNETKR